MNESHDIEDLNHNEYLVFKSRYTKIFFILFIIGFSTCFFNVVKGPFQSILNSNLLYKGYEVGLFPPLFLLISIGLFSSKKPLQGLFVHLFFLITVFAELFYNHGGLILRSSNHIVFVPFFLYMTSVLGIFILFILGTIELNNWNNKL